MLPNLRCAFHNVQEHENCAFLKYCEAVMSETAQIRIVASTEKAKGEVEFEARI
jgi:hypothetical protein